MTFYPEKLSYVAEQRGLTIVQLAALGGIATKRMDLMLAGEAVPSTAQIKLLCDNIAIPYYAFFSKSFKIRDREIIDFRKKEPEVFKYGAHAKALYRNIRIQNFFVELYSRLDLPAPQKLLSIEIDGNPEQFSQSVRYELEIDNYQFSTESKKDFFRELRRRIENLGIYVVQDHNISNDIDGFALFHDKFTSNYIFINSSRRNSGRKSFTIAHELAHILGKRSAISDDYESDNDVEDFCNRFASSLLMPRGRVIEFIEKNTLFPKDYASALEAAREISNQFKTSISAALVRMHQIGLTDENYYFEFAKSFGQADHPDSIKQKQGGGPPGGPDQGAIAIAYLGERAAALFSEASKQGITTPFEISERTGLSKERIDRMIAIAKERGYSLT